MADLEIILFLATLAPRDSSHRRHARWGMGTENGLRCGADASVASPHGLEKVEGQLQRQVQSSAQHGAGHEDEISDDRASIDSVAAPGDL